METPTTVTLEAKLARLKRKDSDDIENFYITGQELLTRLREAGIAVSDTFFSAFVLNGPPMRNEGFYM